MDVARDGGADHIAFCLVNMPSKQAAALFAVESFGQRTSYLERALALELPLEACRRAGNGARWVYQNNP